MPHKASSGSSGTQTHWPSSHLPGSHQDVIVPRFRTEKAWLGGPAAAPDASSPAGLEAGWGHGAAGPQLPITVQRTCRTFPCSQWGCRARARMGRGWGVRGPMAGLLRGLECERAGWGCAGRCERAGGRGRGGEMREGLGEGCAGWRNSSRESDIHNLSTLLLLPGLLEEPETPPSPVCLRPSH